MSNITVKQLFASPDNQTIQKFVLGSTFSAMSYISIPIRNHSIPKVASVASIKFYQLQAIINGFIHLQQNWDSYDAIPISAIAIETALEVLNQLNRDDTFSKGIEVNVFPMRDGGIQFEFDAEDLCAELEIDTHGQMFFILFDEEANVLNKVSIFNYELSEISALLEEAQYA